MKHDLSRYDGTIWALVFGATTGASLRGFGKNKLEFNVDIPWEKTDDGAIYWPHDWLKNIIKLVKNYAKPGDIVAPDMWGADLVVSSQVGLEHAYYKIQHYASLNNDYLNRVLGNMSQLDMYLQTGGANAAFYQPAGQLIAYLERQAKCVGHPSSFMTVADYITALFAVKCGQDAVTAQSQGLYHNASRDFYCSLFPQYPYLFYKGTSPIFDINTLLDSDGIYCKPCGHDSVDARMVAFATGCEWAIWSGTWLGTATLIDGTVQPSEVSFEAGIGFEGLGFSRAAITNVAALGKIYKELVRVRAGKSYQEASKHILQSTPYVSDANIDEMPEDFDEAIKWLSEKCYITFGDNGWLSVAEFLLKGAAKACYEKIKATAEILNLPMPKEVGIIGGWSENKAFIRIFESQGIKIIVPKSATIATHAGVAAEALRRWYLLQGCKVSFSDSLSVIESM